MGKIDWLKALDLQRAVDNVQTEFPGDWHQDPWGWPELGFLATKATEQVVGHAGASGCQEAVPITVPKENWGTRPAVVMPVLDRVLYQALVDRLSVDLIGDLSPNVFGWRLPPTDPKRGHYSHNSHQWDGFRNHLALLVGLHDVALKSDLVSCFASMPIALVQEHVQDRCASGAVTTRLCDLLGAFGQTPDRSGLPQRSLASSVIANMYLRPLDDVLLHFARPIPAFTGSDIDYAGFARWMDDLWLFCDDRAVARKAQLALYSAAHDLGLNLNSNKTDVIAGDELERQVIEIEHSAVDDAIDKDDFTPLEELVDRILEDPERASRTTVRFAANRAREHERGYRMQELLVESARMPHVADALMRLFKERFKRESLQPWFLDYAKGDWALHQWAIAQYARTLPSDFKPRGDIQAFFAECVRDANTSLPLLAVTAQRLGAWDPSEARVACNDASSRSGNPHSRRVLALVALGAGEGRAKVKRWLKADPENAPTYAMLDHYSWVPPKVQADFAD